MVELLDAELLDIDGGKTLSDWLLYGSGVAACFVSPPIGIAICTVVFLCTD